MEDLLMDRSFAISTIWDAIATFHGYLEMIIEKAEYLVDKGNGAKNLVVAIDDPDWLKFHMKRLKKTYPEWYVYIIKEPENHLVPEFSKWLSTLSEPYSNYHNMRSAGGSESGAYMFSSLKLMQQCSGFVGHFFRFAAFPRYHEPDVPEAQR